MDDFISLTLHKETFVHLQFYVLNRYGDIEANITYCSFNELNISFQQFLFLHFQQPIDSHRWRCTTPELNFMQMNNDATPTVFKNTAVVKSSGLVL